MEDLFNFLWPSQNIWTLFIMNYFLISGKKADGQKWQCSCRKNFTPRVSRSCVLRGISNEIKSQIKIYQNLSKSVKTCRIYLCRSKEASVKKNPYRLKVKGQMISDWLLDVFIWTKNNNKKLWWISSLKSNKWSNQKALYYVK